MTKQKAKATKRKTKAPPGEWSVEYRPIPEEWGIRHGSRIVAWRKTEEQAKELMKNMKAAAGPATARKTKAA